MSLLCVVISVMLLYVFLKQSMLLFTFIPFVPLPLVPLPLHNTVKNFNENRIKSLEDSR